MEMEGLNQQLQDLQSEQSSLSFQLKNLWQLQFKRRILKINSVHQIEWEVLLKNIRVKPENKNLLVQSKAKINTPLVLEIQVKVKTWIKICNIYRIKTPDSTRKEENTIIIWQQEADMFRELDKCRTSMCLEIKKSNSTTTKKNSKKKWLEKNMITTSRTMNYFTMNVKDQVLTSHSQSPTSCNRKENPLEEAPNTLAQWRVSKQTVKFLKNIIINFEDKFI